jgi:hypothetical protein
MKGFKCLALAFAVGGFLLSACATSAHRAYAVDMKEVEKELTTTGVEGWIHGSVETQGIYVFTYRTPGNFFDYVEMSLVSDNPNMMKQFATFDRHDKVRVKGSFIADNPSPQKHIMVGSIELITKYNQPYPVDPYQHQAKIPDDLIGKSSGTFLVHAVSGHGQVLVVEFKDVILPIFVKNGALTQSLYRGDLVQLAYKIQNYPDEPVHLNIDETAPQPVQVLQSIKALHGKPGTVEGALILFPKSPEIMFNVFAVQQLLPAGLNRQFTLVNFDNPDVFTQIRTKLQAAWDKAGSAYVNGRNKLVSLKIRVRATGTFNEVDPSQANPQILLNSADAVQIVTE